MYYVHRVNDGETEGLSKARKIDSWSMCTNCIQTVQTVQKEADRSP
jgi:hypothetical protein